MTYSHDRSCFEQAPVTWRDTLLIGMIGGAVMSLLFWIGFVL